MAFMSDILKKLEGGDHRSIGRVAEVVDEVTAQPALFETVLKAVLADDPMVRMRAADAVEKITATQPHYLQPYKDILINQVAHVNQQEVRWHVAQILPRLSLNRRQRESAVEILFGYLQDKSKIVKTFSLQALADFAEKDSGLRRRVVAVLEEMIQSGSPAVTNRGKKLLAELRKT
jgi:hypothetical protein